MNSAKSTRPTQSKAVASGGERRLRLHRSDFSRRLWKTSALSTVAALASSGAVQGQEAAFWQPQVRAIVGGDEQGAFTALEGFIPLTQTADSVVFLDLRLEYDNSVGSDGPGGDVGIGLRRIINPDLIVGGYAYLNVERFDGNQFTGATLGVEAIATNFDAHVNVNLPFGSQSQDESSATSSLSFIGNQLLEQVSLLNVRDYASWGVEGEIGVQAPLALPPDHSLRLSVGGYHFEDVDDIADSITGAKAGLEYKFEDVFSKGASITVGGEVRYDNVYDTTLVGYARLTIPLGERAAPGNGERETIYNVSEGLRKRANDRVRGDIGVRVDTDETTASFTRRARNVAGQEFGLFFFADGENTLGLGTLGDPTTLDDAVARAASGFVVALGGSGNLLTGGVTLPNGQTVIGGGQSVQALLLDGSTRSFALGGSDGTIQGTNPANPVLNLGNGNTVQGITVTGGGVGILGNNVNGATLTNVTVSGTGGDGAAFTGTSTGINASNFSATGNGGSGLSIVGDGTYNFTGTTLLSGNAVDGLSITGNGTYNFQTINALNNGDDGIEVTSTSGTFTTTGGTISGNGDIGVKIDPINANVVLSSITHNGGTSGVVLDDVAGSFTVTGATNIANTSGPAIAILNSPASIRFGDLTMTNPGGAGMTFAGTNGPVVVGGIVISGLGAGDIGLDFSGSRTTFTAQSVDIMGTNAAGSIGIDLSATLGAAAITITNGGIIANVDTGVMLGIAGSFANTANAIFTFGGGTIGGTTASLDARGLNPVSGSYAFGSTVFTGPQLFAAANIIFVGSAATGAGDGSSANDLATIDTADTNTDTDAVFVLVNDGSAINDADGFTLGSGQTFASFGNGAQYALGGLPLNVTGINVQNGVTQGDPTGNGAATLTSGAAAGTITLGDGTFLANINLAGTGVGNVANLGNNTSLDGINISGGSVGVFGNNISGATLTNVAADGASSHGASFTGTSTNISASSFTASGNGGSGLSIVGDGTYNFTGTTLLSGNTGDGLAIAGNGTYNFQTLNALNNTADGIDVSGGGTFTTTGGNLSGNTTRAIVLANVGAGVVLNSITQTGGTTGVDLNTVAGSLTFGAVTITSPGGDGIAYSGINGTTTAGTVTISGLGGAGDTGLDFSGSTTNFSATSVNISGTNAAGSTGIDLSGTQGGSITITNGGTIQGVGTGVQMGSNGAALIMANTDFVFGGGSIQGNTASLDMRGLLASSGAYAFGNTALIGPQLFDATNIIFVAAIATGAGDGSSVNDLADFATADAIGDASAIFVLVNDGNEIATDADGFSLNNGQTLASFGNGATFNVGGAPINVTGTNVATNVVQGDPTGNGAARLVNNTAGGATIVLGSGNLVADLIASGNATGSTIAASGVNGLRIDGVSIDSGLRGLDFSTVSGSVNVDDLVIDGTLDQGILIANSVATINVANLVTTDVAGADVSLTNNSGAITIGGTITNTAGDGVAVSGGSASISVDANITSSAGAAARVDGATGGSVDFSGTIASTGAGDLFNIGSTTAPTGGTISFTGAGLTATGSGNAVIGGLGAGAAVTLSAPLSVTGAGASGISVSNAAGAVTFGDVSVSNSIGDGISITNNTGALTFGGQTTITNPGLAGVDIEGSNGTIDFANLDIALQTANSTGFDLSGAIVNGNITATDFDLTSTTPTGTVGVSLVNTTRTGSQVVQLGDSSTPFDAGQSATIMGAGGNLTGPATGVLVSSATNVDFIFGDGEAAADVGSRIAAATPVNDDGTGLPNHGTDVYNFLDVNLVGETSNLATGLTLYYVDNTPGGDGSRNNPGTIAGAIASTADAIVLVNNGGTSDIGSADQGSGTTLTLDPNQRLYSFAGGTINVGGGAPGNFLLTGITSGQITNPTSGTPTLTTTAGAAQTVTLANNNLLQGIVVSNGPGGFAVFGNGINTLTVAGSSLGGLSLTNAIGMANLTDTTFSSITLVGGSSSLSAANVDISNSSSTQNAFEISGGHTGIVIFDTASTITQTGEANAVFVSGKTAGTVTFGGLVTANTGSVGAVLLQNNTGATINFNGGLDINTTTGTGLVANGGGTVNIAATAGSETINATAGQAISLANVTANITLDSVTAGGGANGVLLDQMSGSLTVAGAVTINNSIGDGLLITNSPGTVNFASAVINITGGDGIEIGGANGAITISGGAIGNIDDPTGRGVVINGGDGSITINASVSKTTAGDLVEVADRTGGTATFGGNLSATTSAGGIDVNNNTAGTIDFSGATKTLSTGANTAVSLVNNAGATVNFSGGGLDIDTTSGAGFTVSGGGTVSVTGTGNSISTGTGTALNLAGATIGAGGFTLDGVSANGAATGIALTSVAGDAINLGAVTLLGITSRGVDVTTALGSALNFSSLNVGLAANAVGLDLADAAITANITANDFDVNGNANAGTLGIDMSGTTGAGVIQLGDLVNNNPAGQTSTILNVARGVLFSPTTNASLVFGDGLAPAESRIETFGNGRVIDSSGALPTVGSYDFDDVTFVGDTSNLTPVSLYFVDPDGDGDGTLANPGSINGAETSTANVIVLVDKSLNGTSGAINMVASPHISGGAANSIDLDDGQVLLSFASTDGPIDVANFGISGVGAPASFSFTTISTSTIVNTPAGIDTVRPTLTTNVGNTINLASTGTGTVTGGVANVLMTNTGTGAGISGVTGIDSEYYLRNNTITAAGNALLVQENNAVAGGDRVRLFVDNNSFTSTTAVPAVSVLGQNFSPTQNSIAVRSFLNNTANGRGVQFNNVHFDSAATAGDQAVNAGTLTVGTTAARVQGNGVSFLNPIGTLNFTTLNIANNSGTGLLVDTKVAGTTFTLTNAGGAIDTTAGVAADLDPLTVNLTFASINASGGTSGIIFDTVAGTFAVTGAATISGTSGFGISAINTNTGTFNFNTVTIDNDAAVNGGGIGWASGTLNVVALANIDTTSGAGISQTGGAITFSNGLTIDTTTGTGILATGAAAKTLNVAASGARTLNSTGAAALALDTVAANVNLQSTSSSGGANNVNLANVSGTLVLGTGTMTGATGTSFNIAGGTASVTYSGGITQANAGQALVSVSGGHATGTITFNTGTLSATNGTGLQFNDADGTYNFNGTTTLNGGDAGIDIIGGSGGSFTFGTNTSITSPTGTAFNVVGGTASVTYSGNVTQANGQALVSVSGGHATGTITFNPGTLSATNGSGLQFDNADGTYNFNGTTTLNGGDAGIDIIGGSGGTFVFGTGATLTHTAAGTAFNLNGSNANVTYSGSISDNNGEAVDIDNHDAGTVTFQTGSISATGTGIRVANSNGGTVNFNGQTTISTGANTGVDLGTSNAGGTVNFNSTGNGLDITTTSGIGFLATGGGTVSVTGSGNTINSGAGTALNIANTTIGAADVTFQSISSIGGSATGIILDTTGSAGGLHVTGTGTAGTGGTIANKTGADGAFTTGNGIYLNNTADVRLAGMQLNDFQNSAIRGFAVNGFSLEDSVISGAVGNNTGPIEGAIAFGDVLAVGTVGLSGNSLIDNVNISGSIEHQIEIYNQSGTMNLTISNSSIHDGGVDGIQIEQRGTAQSFVHIDNNQIFNMGSQAIQISALEDSNLHATISRNVITRGTQGNEGILVANGGNADARVMIGGPTAAQGNTISGFGGVAIFFGQVPGQGTSQSLLEATIQNNTVTSPASATNHAILAFVSSQVGQVSQTRLLIDSNIVTYNSAAARAILVDAPDNLAGIVPEFHATVTNNVVTATDVNAATMISVAARNNSIGRSDVRGNDVNFTGGSTAAGINVREATGGSNVLARGTSASNDSAAVLAANNPLSTTAILPAAGDIPVVENSTIQLPATPTLPSLPLLAAEGGVAAIGDDLWGDVLTGDTLDNIVAAAIQRWAATGLADEQLAALNAVTFEIADLGGNYLGLEGGSHIQIDDDGAGYGWFVDATPLDDEEFANRTDETRLVTDGSQAPAGQYDLLTTIMHEFGHVLGLGDTYAIDQSSTLMYGWLQTGERRLPNVVYTPNSEHYSASTLE
jgi:hypothetical protein